MVCPTFVNTTTDKWDEQTILTCLGEVERNSSHPMGKALVALCDEKSSKGIAPKEVKEIPVKGMKALFAADAMPPPHEKAGRQ